MVRASRISDSFGSNGTNTHTHKAKKTSQLNQDINNRKFKWNTERRVNYLSMHTRQEVLLHV